ncbi:MAG: tetratricopeptide repeat protein [Flavobacteriales bacterium]|nr:tetratricopeptide repeat protein [Flavobacteriales bacterium]
MRKRAVKSVKRVARFDLPIPVGRRILLAISLCLLLNISASAQKTVIYNNSTSDYRLGMELMEKRKFGAAQREFEKIAQAPGAPNSDVKANAEYYAALCALNLFNKDAEYLFKRFIQEHPENPKVKTAYFQLGIYKFRRHSYTKAIEWFSQVDKYDLNNTELSEYYFKLGYSYLVKGDIERARTQFYEIKDADTKYMQPAVYYYSHISYLNQNYETALQGFEKLKDEGSYTHIVPYYIAQIYYMQKKHEKLIAYAIPLLDSANTKRAPEIARLIGEAYYATDKYAKAVPYLKRYLEEGHHQSRDDLYQLAYAYYKSDATAEAIDLFKQVVNTPDALAQNAYYHLADCFVKLDKKKFARFAFRSASKMEFNKKIQEDALFSYAKLSYDLGLNPIFALNRYINKYPKNKRVDKAYEYLVQVYLTTKNYKKALKSLDRISNKNPSLKAAYQRIAYYRAVELFNDKKYSESIALFGKSLDYPTDKKIEAESHYWSGESWYRLGRYKKAARSYEAFIYSPASFNLPTYNQVNYNLGYAYFKKADYENSNLWFRKFVRHVDADFKIKRTKDTSVKQVWSRVGDANLRIADGYFIGRDYETALEYYDKLLGLIPDSMASLGYSVVDEDYAIFQKALSHGVLGQTEREVKVLHQFLVDHPNSTYTDDAKFNMGKAYSALSKHDSAIVWYQAVIDDHPNSSEYLKRSILNLGLAYRNKGENQIALVTFNRVLKDFPATREAKDALMALKSIYIDLGDITPWTELVASLTWADASNAELDSAYYEAVEVLYMKGDCQRAIKDFASYLIKFPEGFFTLNANYYRSECYSRIGDSISIQEAITGYDFVLRKLKMLLRRRHC